MNWLAENWGWLLFGGMIAVHLFGHRHGGAGGGCCGSGGRHEATDEGKPDDKRLEGPSTTTREF